MGKLTYICKACDYQFTAEKEFKAPCPYCGQRKVKEHKFNAADGLIRDSVKYE